MRSESFPLPYESVENKEQAAEEIVSERVGILGRITERLKNTYLSMGNNVKEMSPEVAEKWSKIKGTPFFRGIALATEGFLGTEPGQTLNSKQSLVKCVAGALLTAVDILRKRSGMSPEEDFFKGKTFEVATLLKNALANKEVPNILAISLNALVDFLEKNKGLVTAFEDHLEELSRKTY